MANTPLIQALQASISPCILISGAGLLLLSMTNRLSRPIERIRHLCDFIKSHPQQDNASAKEQIAILYKRCEHLRAAIVCNTLTIALVSLIILSLFLDALYAWPMTSFIVICFVLSLVSLTTSMVYFFMDIFSALDSLKIEVNHSQNAG